MGPLPASHVAWVTVADYDRNALLGGALVTRLREASFPLTDFAEREFYDLVCAYVGELKALGVLPERVIMAVKHTADEAGVFATPRLIELRAPLDGKDKLLADMVRWCIERYYGTVLGTTVGHERAPATSHFRTDAVGSH